MNSRECIGVRQYVHKADDVSFNALHKISSLTHIKFK